MINKGNSPIDARLMSWENFRTNFLEDGLAAQVPVTGSPNISVFAEPGATAIGLRTQATPGRETPVSNVEAISVGNVDGQFQIRVADPKLYQPFFAFLLDISNRVQLDHQEPEAAFTAALASWRQMLSTTTVLSDEMQLGLTGELWTLRRLMQRCGTEAIPAWTGADKQAHDFRLGTEEIEVKTTSGEVRKHHINRIDQLVPSPNMNLYVLSLQMISAGVGPGFTLADQVNEIRSAIATDTATTTEFEEKLERWGWHDIDSQFYPRRRRIGSPAILVFVDDEFPRLEPDVLDEVLGPLRPRIDEVRYRINLTGLGWPDGDPAFIEVLPIKEPNHAD